MSAKGFYDYVKNFLQDRNARLIDYGAPIKDNFIAYLNDNAANLIVPHRFDGMEEISKARIVQMMYSMGLDGISVRAKNFMYRYREYLNYYFSDLVLTYGKCYADHLSGKGLNAVAVGNPLFDDWFRAKIPEKRLGSIKKRIDAQKKSILYLPTCNISSSIDTYYDSLKKMARKYNVIAKLHHVTFCGESDRVCKLLSDQNIITLGDHFDPLALYAIADIVLTDGISGAIFDAVSLSKRAVVINTGLDKYKTIDLLNGSLSIPCVTDPEELEGVIEDSFHSIVKPEEGDLNYLFNFRDGNAGLRAAQAVLKSNRDSIMTREEKFDRGIRNSPDEETTGKIIRLRDRSLNKQKRSTPRTVKQNMKKYIKSALRLR
ncbi:hypothetical protein ACFL42_05250 [Candidatus Omnitrophota bacterium]